jgi:hypothetical protein
VLDRRPPDPDHKDLTPTLRAALHRIFDGHCFLDPCPHLTEVERDAVDAYLMKAGALKTPGPGLMTGMRQRRNGLRRVQYTVSTTPAALAALDARAKVAGMSRSRFVEELILQHVVMAQPKEG